jgi:hypothetical protein
MKELRARDGGAVPTDQDGDGEAAAGEGLAAGDPDAAGEPLGAVEPLAAGLVLGDADTETLATGVAVGVGERTPPCPSSNAFNRISTKIPTVAITKIFEILSSMWTA